MSERRKDAGVTLVELIIGELEADMERYGDPRRTVIEETDAAEFDDSDAMVHAVLARVCRFRHEHAQADRHAERNPELGSPPTGDAVSKAIRRTAAALQLV